MPQKNEIGWILELDPQKIYWFIVKEGTVFADHVKVNGLRMQDGAIYFVDGYDDFKIIEGANRIKGIVVEPPLESQSEGK